MNKKRLYQVLPMIMVGICVVGMCAVGVRIFAKKILIGKLGMENYITCTLADYNWGDRLARTMPTEEDVPEKSEELTRLEAILYTAPQGDVVAPQGDVAAPEADAGTEVGVGTGAKAAVDAKGEDVEWMKRYTDKIFAAEDAINRYCNEKFLLYRQMRDISSGFDAVVGWNLAYARTTGSTYTLTTGYDYQAVEAADLAGYEEIK